MNAPPPGFLPFDPNSPTTIYRRNLPHLRQDGGTYFVTFCLKDSIPRSVISKMKAEAAEMAKRSGCEEAYAYYQIHIQTLDRNLGKCVLAEFNYQHAITETLQYFADPGDKELAKKKEVRYWLGSYVVMPNHLHLLIKPTRPNEYPLEKLLQSIKSNGAAKINRLSGTSGATVWLEESHDRIVRDGNHLRRCIQYIGRNPEKAGIPMDQACRWVHPHWDAIGWGFRGHRKRLA